MSLISYSLFEFSMQRVFYEGLNSNLVADFSALGRIAISSHGHVCHSYNLSHPINKLIIRERLLH